MLAMIGLKLTPIIFFGFQIFWIFVSLEILRVVLKFNWAKSIMDFGCIYFHSQLFAFVFCGKYKPKSKHYIFGNSTNIDSFVGHDH